MIALLRLCRLYYAVPMALTFTLTVVYARGDMSGAWAETLRATTALALVVAAAYAFNDVCDVATDMINAPWRPIPSGGVRRRTAMLLSAGLLAAGMLLAASVRAGFTWTLMAVAAGLLFYDLFSKRLGLLKQPLVAVLMTSIYPLALALVGGATGPRARTLLVFPAWMFLTAYGYELLKDIRDVAGDRAHGRGGAAIATDPRWWLGVARAAVFGGATLLIGPFFLGCGWMYLSVVLVAIALAATSTAMPPRAAIAMAYAECCVVGIAAIADLAV